MNVVAWRKSSGKVGGMNYEISAGRVLAGNADDVRRGAGEMDGMPVDQEMPSDGSDLFNARQTTIAGPVSVSGPGTFFGRATRTLRFEPADDEQGWWLDRTDLPESLPIGVSVRNVWTTLRNIVLCSGSPHNYVRMVEHFVALKMGLGLDNLVVRTDSGDPPLFDRSSLDLVEAVEGAGIVPQSAPARHVTVKEPVSVGRPDGAFLTFLPHEKGAPPLLKIDCAVNFKTAIGKQRIRFDVTRKTFTHGAFARTNTNLGMMIYCLTIGKLFADVRNLGYTRENILIAGKNEYLNEPRMRLEGGKSLEAAWHRAALDLLAAVALIDTGRLAGTIVSYKAGHALDVLMIKMLYKHKLLTELRIEN